MIALIDCNNFYASCERLFRPQFNGHPVIVLSNNDGCVIARSNEAKSIDIKMGAVFHFIENIIKENNVAVFSSNYTLYGDMSARVMNNIARFSPSVEVYSIDECFIEVPIHSNFEEFAHRMRNAIIQNTGIPVSIGIAPTKTLAKLANKLCKKTGGVCVLDKEDKISAALLSYPVEDLWGVGRAYASKLISLGINTASDLRNLPIAFVQEKLTIQGVRMHHELWGRSCIPLETILDRKKALCTSRSFGRLVHDLEELKEATASYASRLSGKLRKEKCCATVLSVRLLTNKFKTDELQASPGISIPLNHPVNNTYDITKAALYGLLEIYRTGYRFQKVEIMATGLIPESEVQLNIFTEWNGKKNDALSQVMDKINSYYGKGTLRMAVEGREQKWSMRRKFLSSLYTTKWEDIIRVH